MTLTNKSFVLRCPVCTPKVDCLHDCLFSTVYLLLGLIAMLVVLETLCELQQLKKLRKMFYLKKEKSEDQLTIMEHDHLSFTSMSDQGAPVRDYKTDLSPDISPISASGTPVVR